MWFLTVTLIFIVYDFMKLPIDVLYFQNYMRPLVGIRNTIIDIFMYKSKYNVYDFSGLWKVKANFEFITRNYEENVSNAKKHYFHDLDKWFIKNKRYYYYKVSDFPQIQQILEEIPCVDKTTAMFAVMDAPIIIPAHKAESNTQLRYHMTIKSGKDCKLMTHNQTHVHNIGDEIIFDHSRYHKVVKTGYHRRVTLILDIDRLLCYK